MGIDTIDIAPIPAKTVVSIKLEIDKSSHAYVRVFDSSGTEVMDFATETKLLPGKSSFFLNVAPLNPGKYNLYVLCSGKKFNATLTVER